MRKVVYEGTSTVANYGPGFDALGGSNVSPEGDIVEGWRDNSISGVELVEIVNESGLPKLDLPLGPENVAVAVAQKLLQQSGEKGGIKLRLIKRMRIGTGTGSSASTSAAATLVTNDLLEHPYKRDAPEILEALVHGEAVATKGSGHADNVLPASFGGFVLLHELNGSRYTRFEGPDNFYFVLASPTNIVVNTGDARRILPRYTRSLAILTAGVLERYSRDKDSARIGDLEIELLEREGASADKILDYLSGAIYLVKGIREKNPEIFGNGMLRVV